MKRIVVLISGSGTNMQAIVEACNNGRVAGEVVAVISNKADVGGLEKAQAAGIATAVLSHKDYPSREAYDADLQRLIDTYQPDLVVLAGFMRILTPEFTRHYHGRMLNIHPSLLPKYKGVNTHQRALDAGDTEHGVSVHFVTEELDGGPVILQATVPVFPEDTAADLQQRVHTQEHAIYPLVVNWFCTNRLRLTADGAELDGELLGPAGYAAE
ncbi:phosphoribosylglycinamide formyltransferase [Pseudidiomarina tainanensis]|jgi:phosphoribosylglycinamide formyltransferase-1|uniref:Phosphoribosylglycinamide formyltransferase n=2 Tax=Pseudidiomarina TaxID=2800384 RepID=A0A1I6G5B6_9GAMM|nr:MULTISPECIES: phosphoribosylglycinamide formyltransferase [Pseudidiomarina]RZQ57141.1 phosphoribosylglycinamide formyltransferase [Pseudidiomarina tainanensis]SFR37310.1 phosphoribosylglycinamide formyltransferase-1 [Pseudidiomarina maritima]